MATEQRFKFLEYVITCVNKNVYGKKFLKNSPIKESDLHFYENDDVVICNFYYMKDYSEDINDINDELQSSIMSSWFSKSHTPLYNRLCRFYLEKNIEHIFLCSEILIKNKGDLSIIVDSMKNYNDNRNKPNGYSSSEDNLFKLSLIYNCAVYYPEGLSVLSPLVSKKYYDPENVKDFFDEKFHEFPSLDDVRKAIKTFITIGGKNCFSRGIIVGRDDEWENVLTEELSV